MLPPHPVHQSLLFEHGRFPEKFRRLIWRFLLRLPENASSHSDLVRKGVHTAYRDLHLRFPMRDTRLLKRLRRCLSCLAHWSPVFGELAFLPELAFPFVKVFGARNCGLSRERCVHVPDCSHRC